MSQDILTLDNLITAAEAGLFAGLASVVMFLMVWWAFAAWNGRRERQRSAERAQRAEQARRERFGTCYD